jgi:hypothetical protein
MEAVPARQAAQEEIDKMSEPIKIPEGIRPLDLIDHHMHDTPKPKPIRSLQEAKWVKDASVVIEGDWGGTIYCTVPAKYVRCSESQLRDLATALERKFWDCNFCVDGVTEAEHGGEGVYFTTRDFASGGMGGGPITDGLWIHDSLPEELFDLIKETLNIHEDVNLYRGDRGGHGPPIQA